YPPLKEAGAGIAEAQLLPLPNALDGLRRSVDQPPPSAATLPSKAVSKPKAHKTPPTPARRS
ncbi:MAG TPA: hypothetical protein VIA18_05215, partial [Polyangia bacterium]|nr:hypothetical protein [Polyangia bacterium]